MQTDVWDSERVRMVGAVLNRYGTFLRPGDRIRMGMEGDPCSVYRGAENTAPCATVLGAVHRDDSGVVRFRATFDVSKQVIDLDTAQMAPDMMWEVEPDFLRDNAFFDGREPNVHEVPTASRSSDDPDEVATHLATFGVSLEGIRERVAAIETELSDRYRGGGADARMQSVDEAFEEALAHSGVAARLDGIERTLQDAFRAMSGDVMNASRGQATPFCNEYARDYDKDRHDIAQGEFRGAAHGDNDTAQPAGRKSRGVDPDDPGDVEPLQYHHDLVTQGHARGAV